MNQEKIGKFIAEKRKAKNLTQEEFAEKLGISSKSVSRWENGKCMPDLSLLIPISKELDISVNELISGEQIVPENYQQKLEQNVINTAIVVKKQLYKMIWKMLLIVLVICFSIIAGIVLFLLINEYEQQPIYLKQNELNIEVCDYDERYYAIMIKTKDGIGAHYTVKKDFNNKNVNFRIYRTRIENRDSRLLENVGIGFPLIEKSIQNVYYDSNLIWNHDMKIRKCEEY